VKFAQFHTDPKAAKRSRFGGLIASGWHTCGIAMRLVTDAVLQDSESFASPGIGYIKWPHPVRPGDRLTLRATVLEMLDLETTSLLDLTKP